MKLLFIPLLTMLAASSIVAAQSSVVYRCTGADGVPTYTNNAQGLKGCEVVSGVAVTTVPAFKAPPAASTSRTTTTGNPGPQDFPKVDSEVQKQRDELGRRPILERELRDREERCATTRKDTNNGAPLRPAGEDQAAYNQRLATAKSQLERCDADLAAIRRELAALK